MALLVATVCWAPSLLKGSKKQPYRNESFLASCIWFTLSALLDCSYKQCNRQQPKYLKTVLAAGNLYGGATFAFNPMIFPKHHHRFDTALGLTSLIYLLPPLESLLNKPLLANKAPKSIQYCYTLWPTAASIMWVIYAYREPESALHRVGSFAFLGSGVLTSGKSVCATYHAERADKQDEVDQLLNVADGVYINTT